MNQQPNELEERMRTRDYSERRIKGHVVGIERLEPQRWRLTVDGRRLFTFCTEARARQAGALEAGRLAFSAAEGCGGSAPPDPPEEPVRQPAERRPSARQFTPGRP